METQPTVFVVDDEAAIRCWLETLLSDNGFRVECFASAEEFLVAFDPNQPACVILDVRMPGSDGFELQRRLITQQIPIPIIFLTASRDIKSAVYAMRKGAFHFLPKPVHPHTLIAVVRDAAKLETHLHRRRAFCEDVERRVARLTPSEREVLERLVEGKSSRTIAVERGRSNDTVRKQRTNILKKTRVDSVAELVRLVTAAWLQVEAHSPACARWTKQPSRGRCSRSQLAQPTCQIHLEGESAESLAIDVPWPVNWPYGQSIGAKSG